MGAGEKEQIQQLVANIESVISKASLAAEITGCCTIHKINCHDLD